MAHVSTNPEVLVIGGGMAALGAALSARRCGASVMMVEQAPRELRGGNTRHSRNFRFCHQAPTPLAPDCYDEMEFRNDLHAVGDRACDDDLVRLFVARSARVPEWLRQHRVAFQTSNIPYSRKTAFLLGGGKALINSLYAAAEALGVEICYDTQVLEVGLDAHIDLLAAGRTRTIQAGAVVACSGGYQANRDWLRQEWGPAEAALINRGTAYARGGVLRSLLDQGVAAVGQPGACHLVAVDARSPDDDGGVVTRIDGMEWGVVVDGQGRRICDETAVTGPTRYAVWGKLVGACVGQSATLILDADGIGRVEPAVFPPLRAQSVPELAEMLGMSPELLDASIKDAQRLTAPPLFAFPMRPGITFTCYGVKVDALARLVLSDGQVCPNLFAAGMIMVPNILGTGYLAGAGLTIGAVFGAIAGEEAARHALR